MSFANPKPSNPATKFIDFKAERGIFQYYVKPEKESEKGNNIELSLPIRFIVIDELSTIAGFNDENQTGVYSNEVHNLQEILSVKLFPKKDISGNFIKGVNKIGVIGIYSEIKGDIQSLGGKFAKSIYALMIIDGKTELVNLKVKGSFLNAWIEANIDTDNQGIFIEACTKKTKGKNTYYEPLIKGFTPENPVKTLAVAQRYYKILKDYFEKRKHYTDEQVIVADEENPDALLGNEGDLKQNDDLPF